ncbi:MAG: hypothetical protein HDR80_06020 [Bacteroides sp.]|nr:hypothetical protein [Bacteroides sp.]
MMPRSAWWVWCHPRVSAAELNMNSDRVEELEREILGLQADLQADRRYAADLERVREALEKEVRQLKEANSRQEQRINEWMSMREDLEEALDQLQKMVALRDRMNSMRVDYEQRIEKLEMKLRAARVNGPQFADPDRMATEESELTESGSIEPPTPATIRIEPPERLHIVRPSDDTEWLRPLPENIDAPEDDSAPYPSGD